MSNADLFEQVKELHLPKGKYALFGSTPMGIRGLKECHDADVIVTEDVFDEYRNKENWVLKKTEKSEYLEKGKIELWKNWGADYFPSGTWNILKLINEAEIIKNLPFVRLEEVLRSKRLLGSFLKRESDTEDIRIINEFLKEN